MRLYMVLELHDERNLHFSGANFPFLQYAHLHLQLLCDLLCLVTKYRTNTVVYLSDIYMPRSYNYLIVRSLHHAKART